MGISATPFGSKLPSEIEEYARHSDLHEADWQQLSVRDEQLSLASRKTAIDVAVLIKAGFTEMDLEAIRPFTLAIHSLDDKTPALEIPMMVLSLYSSYAERYGEMPSPTILDEALKVAEPAYKAQKQYGLLTDWLATTFEDTHGIELRAADE